MLNEIQEALRDLRERQQAGEHMPCPRCGQDTMRLPVMTNALSRHAEGIFLCEDCGTAEALLDFMRNPLPIECWAIFRDPVGDTHFRDVPGKEVWEQIRMDHGPILIDIFKRWTREQPGADFREYRREAFRACPGLTQIWERPFQVMYEVADGQLILRFRETDDGIEIAADLLTDEK